MIWIGSGMLVRVCVVLGGRGRDGTMMVVGSRWKREGIEGRKEKEGRSASYVYRRQGRIEWVLLISFV